MTDDKGPMAEPRSTEQVLRESPPQPDPGTTTRTDGRGDDQGRRPDQEAG